MLGVCLAGHWEEVGVGGGRKERGVVFLFFKISIYYILRSSICKKLIPTLENTRTSALIDSRGQLQRY
jgi:hypothetical protein